MKKWMLGIICIVLVFPVTAQAVLLEEAKTQKEVEAQVIASIYQLKTVMWNSDFFDWDVWAETGSKLIDKALNEYPESMRLHLQMQELTSERINGSGKYYHGDTVVLRDSLANQYKSLYEDNKRSPLYITLYGFALDDPEQKIELAEKALKRDTRYYWAHLLLADACITQEKYDEALAYVSKAIEIDSMIVDGYIYQGYVYYVTREFEKILPAALKAYELAPHPSIARHLYFPAKRGSAKLEDKQQLAKFERAAFYSISPIQEEVLWNMANRAEEAYKTFRDLDQLDSASYYLDLMLAYTAPLKEGLRNVAGFNKVCFEAYQGNKDEALNLLASVVDDGFSAYGYVMDAEDMTSLKDSPRFQELLARMKEKAREQALAERVAEPAPDFTLVSVDGDTVRLSDLRGKVVIIDFWGIGCGPCYQLMPVIEKFYQAHKDEVYVYGIESWKHTAEEVSALLEKQGWTYPNLLATTEVLESYGVKGVPHMVVIDSDGDIAFTHHGFGPGEGHAQAMLDQLEWLLEELR